MIVQGHNFLGAAHLRFLPKVNGARPIVNLRRKNSKYAKTKSGKNYTFSVNQVLQNAFQVLSFERSRNSALLASGVTSQNEIYNKLKHFKKKLGNRSERFYICKVDIKACFDTIKQDVLLTVLEDVIVEVKILHTDGIHCTKIFSSLYEHGQSKEGI